MSANWPSAFKQWLIEHDVRLRPPADPTTLLRLRAMFGGAVHRDLISMYETFDGCDQGDFEVDSFLTIWPIDDGIAFAQERGFKDELPIADVSFSAGVAVCSVMHPGAPVRWLNGMYGPSSSLKVFCEDVMNGRF